MKDNIKRKWIYELRSGRHKQICGRLRDDNGIDALGVLNKIREKEEDIFWDIGTSYVFEGRTKVLPARTIEWAGLPRGDSKITLSSGKTIAELNDLGFTFEELADIVEKTL